MIEHTPKILVSEEKATTTSSDERLLVVHADLSRVEHTAERMPSSAQYCCISQHSTEYYCQRVFRGPKMAVASLHLFAAMSCLFILSLLASPAPESFDPNLIQPTSTQNGIFGPNECFS